MWVKYDKGHVPIRDAQVKAETLAALAELPPPVVIHTNGHSKPETVN